jgi:predicted glutamine amidotransferase
MCIAILNQKKAGRLPKSQIKNSWDNNDMGAGLLWDKGGKLNVFKTYDYDEFIDKYNSLRDDKDVGNIVLHFRIATSGYNGEHNLHPFLVNDNLGFVHNGVIQGLGNKQFSDTYEFNDMLKKFNHNFVNCDMTKYFISSYIGYSKLVFLDNEGRFTIINEELGKWVDGNWYSNDSYKQYNNFYYYGNEKVDKTKATSTKIAETKWQEHWLDDTMDYTIDEWDMYDYVCDVYGLDSNDESTWDDVQYYMFLNDAKSIKELYEILVDDYNSIKL